MSVSDLLARERELYRPVKVKLGRLETVHDPVLSKKDSERNFSRTAAFIWQLVELWRRD